MARKLDDVMAALPAERRARIEQRAMDPATLKDLRAAAQKTQKTWPRRLAWARLHLARRKA